MSIFIILAVGGIFFAPGETLVPIGMNVSNYICVGTLETWMCVTVYLGKATGELTGH